MNLPIARGLLALGFVLGWASPLWAHGGSYRGPGTGLGPAGPTGPSTPGLPSPTGPGPGGSPATGGAPDGGGDLTAWQQWWTLNRDAYLELKAALAHEDPVSGTDEFFTGRRDATPRNAGRPAPEVLRDRVIPALTELLIKERNPDITSAALMALAKMGDPGSGAAVQSGPAIRARLASDNQEISETAAIALGLLGNTGASGALVDLLDDTDGGRRLVARAEVPYRTRAFAAYALGLLGRTSQNPDVRRFIVHHLTSTLDSDRSSARDLQVACLIAFGLVPLEEGGASDPGAPPASSRAAQCAYLASWLQDKNRPEMVRVYAPVAYARLAGPRDSPQRIAHLAICSDLLGPGSQASAALTQSAVTALGLVADADDDPSDARARAALVRQTGDGDRLARRLALIALARAGSRPGMGASAEKGLAEARSFLLDQLARGSTPDRPWVALALGLLERGATRTGRPASDRVQDALKSALREHGGPSEAGAYCLALGLSGAPGTGHALLQTLNDSRDDAVRAHAAVSLGLAHETAAIDPLRAIVAESRFRPQLLRDAAIGLGLLGDRTLGPNLTLMLESAQGLSAQAAIATALGFVGDARAVEPLLGIALEIARPSGTRAFAIVALGLICDRALLPWNASIAADVNYWVPPGSLFDPSSGTGVLDIL